MNITINGEYGDHIKRITKHNRTVGEYMLCKYKTVFFNPKYLSDGRHEINIIRNWLESYKQPSKYTVKRAMLWMYDDYMIKSAGESMSDNHFISCLMIDTLDKNGNDTKSVLLKKYSTEFDDVLITIDELDDLFEKYAEPKQISSDKLSQLNGAFRIALKNKSDYTKIIRFISNNYNIDEITNEYKLWNNNAKDQLKRFIETENSIVDISDNKPNKNKTDKFIESLHINISRIDKLYDDITRFKICAV